MKKYEHFEERRKLKINRAIEKRKDIINGRENRDFNNQLTKFSKSTKGNNDKFNDVSKFSTNKSQGDFKFSSAVEQEKRKLEQFKIKTVRKY